MTTLHSQPDLRSRLGRRQKGFSLIELLIVIAIIMVIGTIAVTSYQKAQMSTRETAVIKELESIYGAQTLYFTSFGKYASTLAELGPPNNGTEGPQGANLIPKSLAEGVKNSYHYSMTGNGNSFAVTAIP